MLVVAMPALTPAGGQSCLWFDRFELFRERFRPTFCVEGIWPRIRFYLPTEFCTAEIWVSSASTQTFWAGPVETVSVYNERIPCAEINVLS